MSSRSSRTIYVGNLPGDVRESEIEDLFYKYGRIVDIDLKLPSRPPGYCFVEFEDARDAEEAIRGRDGYEFDGYPLRVELAHGGRGLSSSSDRYSSYSSTTGPVGGVSRRSEYRGLPSSTTTPPSLSLSLSLSLVFFPKLHLYLVSFGVTVVVTGLPPSASWQDLKDHMRRAGDVCFAQVFRDGRGLVGIVDYTNYDDMKYAIRKLDDSEFRNPFSRKYIRVREDTSNGGRRSYSRSRSRSRSFTHSRSRTRSRSWSRSHSRSLSPVRSRSVSKSPRRRSASPRVSRSRSRSKSRSLSGSPRSVSRSRSKSRSPRGTPSPADVRKRSLSRSRSYSEED